MWSSTLLFLTLCGGILGKSDDFCESDVSTACEPKIPFPWKFPKTAEELDHLCPTLLDRLICLKKYTDECEDEVIHDVDNFEKMIAYISDVCNKGSNLREDVLIQLPCIQEVVDDPDDTCTNLTREAITAYKEHVQATIKEYDASHHRMAYCFHTLFDTACFVVNVDRKCGDGGKELGLDALNRVGYLETTCPAETNGELLKLIEALEIDIEQQDLMKEIIKNI